MRERGRPGGWTARPAPLQEFRAARKGNTVLFAERSPAVVPVIAAAPISTTKDPVTVCTP